MGEGQRDRERMDRIKQGRTEQKTERVGESQRRKCLCIADGRLTEIAVERARLAHLMWGRGGRKAKIFRSGEMNANSDYDCDGRVRAHLIDRQRRADLGHERMIAGHEDRGTHVRETRNRQKREEERKAARVARTKL